VFFDDLPANVEAAARRGWHAHEVTPCDNPVPSLRDVLHRHGLL
jgi:hypothetical protein